MDRAEYVHKRKAKYMAQVLEHFENELQGELPEHLAGAAQDFKALVRARMNALAVDAVDIMGLGESNELAQDFRDRISPVGRP